LEADFEKEIMQQQAIEEVKNGAAILLDVRTLEEWNESHAVGAIHIPIDELLAGKAEGLDKNFPVYTYCRSGGRAGKAKDFLVEQGFNSMNVGSLEDWVTCGGEVKS
jgi:rhodanese-related sulfurtransferase